MSQIAESKKSDRLAGKTAVITGGTTGIGFETARQYLAQGAKVMITGSSQSRIEKAVTDLGSDVSGIQADVRNLAELDQLKASVESTFDHLDILFANAGIGYFNPIEDITETGYDNQFDINVKGVFFTIQKLLPLMSAGGSIILNASAVNAKGAPTGSVYFATKAAVRSFARSMAAELGSRGLRVNSLSPGVVRTSFQGKVDMPQEAMDGFMQMVVDQAPLGREGKAIDIANAAVFLASDESSYITGADLTVDGGWMNV